MKKLKKLGISGLLLITMIGLSACGHHKTIKHLNRALLNQRVNRQVLRLKYKDRRLAVVQFKKKPQLIEYRVYKIKNVGKVQDLAAYQTSRIEKKTEDNSLAPKVVMFHLTKKQKREKRYRQKMEHMRLMNKIIYERTQKQSLMFKKQNQQLHKNQIQQRRQLLNSYQANLNNSNIQQNNSVYNSAISRKQQDNVIRHYHHVRSSRYLRRR